MLGSGLDFQMIFEIEKVDFLEAYWQIINKQTQLDTMLDRQKVSYENRKVELLQILTEKFKKFPSC